MSSLESDISIVIVWSTLQNIVQQKSNIVNLIKQMCDDVNSLID